MSVQVNCREHYDMLIDENNDPVHDPRPLRDYMDRWDGQIFIDRLGLNNTQSVLEIGVGTGRLAVRVAPLCRRFYGIDISPKTIKRGRENLAGSDNVTLFLGDFLTYQFLQRFDVIYSSLTFMHIKNKQHALQKIVELLNPGGRFVLSISKSTETYVDTGTRRLQIYPDDPEAVETCAVAAGLHSAERIETEFAYIFLFVK